MKTELAIRSFRAAAIVAMALGFLQYGSAQTVDLTSSLTNPSFDNPTVPAWTTGAPNGWNGDGDTSKFGQGPVYHDGAQGLFFNFASGWNGVNQTSTYTIQKAGEQLTFSTWIKISNLTVDVNGQPNVVWFNEQIRIGGAMANQVQSGYSASADWTQVSVNYTTSAGDVGKAVGVAFGFQSGDWSQTFADQVTLVDVIPTQAASLTWDNGAGTFAWNTNDVNWSGSKWNNTTPTAAIFGATGVGEVSVVEALMAQSVTFGSPGYSLSDGGGTLTITGAITNNADSTLGCILGGGLMKEGPGNLTVAALQLYTGDTTINGGQLTLDAMTGGLYYSGNGRIRINAGGTLSLSGAIGYANQALHFIDPSADSIAINGGTYQHTGASNQKYGNGAGHLFTIGALGATLDSGTPSEEFNLGYRYDYQAPGVVGSTAGGTLTLSGVGNGELNYLFQGSGGLIKKGAGTWKLSNVNTYSGDTAVMEGVLALANGTDNGGQGHGSITSTNITVSAGATFDVSQAFGGFTLSGSQSLLGYGTVVGAVTAASGSKIFAGLDGTYGTNTFNNDLSLGSGTLCYLEVGTSATGTNDRILVNGSLVLNGPVFHIKAPGTTESLDTTTDYVLIQAASNVGGSAVPTPVWDVAPVNAAGFKVLVVGDKVVLRNVTGTPPSVSAFCNPTTVTHFDKVTVTATATPGSSPISAVVLNAAPIGGSPAVTLVNAGGNLYTNTVAVGASAPIGMVTLQVTATDSSFLSGSGDMSLAVIGASRLWNGDGGDDNWSTAPNWVGLLGPGLNGDSVIFTGTTRLTPTMDAGYNLAGIGFDASAGSFVLGTSAGTLTLGGGGVRNYSTNSQTLNIPIVMAGASTFDTSAGDITLGQLVSGSGADLVKAGSGNLILAVAEEYSGSTIVNGGTLAVGSKIHSTGGGPVRINSGGVLSLPSGGFGWGGSLGYLDVTANGIIINGGTLRKTGMSNPQTDSGAGHSFTIGALGATLDSAEPGETFSIGFRYDYPPIITSSAGGTLTLTGVGDGVMDYTLPGSGGVTMAGGGTWTLRRYNNSFTGDVTVRSGILSFSYPTISSAATVLIANNAVLDLAFPQPNTVGALIIGGVTMAPGTYSSANLTASLSGSGSLLVSGYPHPQIGFSAAATSLTVSWPVDYTGWKLLVQTNKLATGISLNPVDWGVVPGSTATNSMTFPLDAGKPSEFYRLSY